MEIIIGQLIESNGRLNYYLSITELPKPLYCSATAISSSQINLTWVSNETYSTVMVVARPISDLSAEPIDGTAYSVGSSLGEGIVIFKGEINSFDHKDLLPNTTYYYRFYTVNNDYYSPFDFKASQNVTTPELLPTTQLTTSSCGSTFTSLGDYIYIDKVVGAEDYEYSFTEGVTTITKQRSSCLYGLGSSYSINLGWISGLEYGKTYSVKVKAKVNGKWGGYGDICSITISGITGTKLSDIDCYSTVSSLGSFIHCDKVTGADDYEYIFDDGITPISKLRSSVPYGLGSNTEMYLQWVNGLKYGTTYSVTIRAKVNGVLGSYGTSCELTILPLAGTKLMDSYCDKTFSGIMNYFYSDKVSGATDYIYHFYDGLGFDKTVARSSVPYGSGSSNQMHLYWIGGLQVGKTYNVEVKTKQGTVESDYGQVCQVTITSAAKSLAYNGNNVNSTTEISIDEVSAFPNPFNSKINIYVNASD